MDAIRGTRARGRRLPAAVLSAGLPVLLIAAAPLAAAPFARTNYTGHPSHPSKSSTATVGFTATVGSTAPAGAQSGSATLVQCRTANQQAERSATFAGEMALIPGAVRMAMRIELLERDPGEAGYRPVLAPGIGVWRTADPGVKVYRHLEQLTNLTAPASYRALITFRWLGPGDRLLRREERHSPSCLQSAPVTGAGPSGAGAGFSGAGPAGAGAGTTPTGSGAPLE